MYSFISGLSWCTYFSSSSLLKESLFKYSFARILEEDDLLKYSLRKLKIILLKFYRKNLKFAVKILSKQTSVFFKYFCIRKLRLFEQIFNKHLK